MAEVRPRGIKRSTETYLDKDDTVGQAKSRCRSHSRTRKSPEEVSVCLHHQSNCRTKHTANSVTENNNKQDGGDFFKRWAPTEQKLNQISGVDFCKLYLHHEGIRLFLEKMKDRDNWHPWDKDVQVSRQPNSRPNSFTLPSEVLLADDITDDVRSMIVEVFQQNNRLEHFYEVMAYHPQYLHCFLRTQQFLMQADGPLPFSYRHYISIMAAARHQCTYLINIHSNEFISEGGDESWLKGLEYAPKRLQKLNEVNKILAHQPWLMSKAHIKQLQGGRDGLSMSEVVQAIIILIHFHSLSSFAFGCGINYSPSTPNRRISRQEAGRSCKECCFHEKKNDNKTEQPEDFDNGVEVLVEKMTRLTQESLTEAQMRERFEKIEIQNTELSSKTVGKKTSRTSSADDILRFVDDPLFAYEDFRSCKRVCGVSTFYEREYSWDVDGYSLSCRLYMDVGDKLDEKFSIAQGLTYYTMGDHADVDTSSFRHAIWNYVHSLYGICHDDYDYSVVDQLVERNLKTYIKTVMCYPERVTRQDYDGFMTGFKHSEKVHVNLMTMEARFQAELLYSLRAIERWYTDV